LKTISKHDNHVFEAMHIMQSRRRKIFIVNTILAIRCWTLTKKSNALEINIDFVSKVDLNRLQSLNA